MFRIFNSFQAVALYTGLPFLISWLHTSPFQYATAAFWAAIVAYVVGFIFLVIAVAEFAKEDSK